MAKISLNKLNLDKNYGVNTIIINENEVEVTQYLPVEKKIEVVENAVRGSIDGGIINPILIDCLFHTGLILNYTNITFTKNQMDNILDTYDLLEKNEVIDKVISAIPEREYRDIIESLKIYEEKTEKEMNSIVGMVEGFLIRLTESVDTVQEKLEGFDLNSENIKNLLTIAKDNSGQ